MQRMALALLAAQLAFAQTAPNADVNATEPDGTTALHRASYRDDIEGAERLLRAGVRIRAHLALTSITPDGAETACVFTDVREVLAADAVVLVTARLPDEELALEL